MSQQLEVSASLLVVHIDGMFGNPDIPQDIKRQHLVGVRDHVNSLLAILGDPGDIDETEGGLD